MIDVLKALDCVDMETLNDLVDNYPPWFIDTGNYALNLQLSGSFFKGFKGRSVYQLGGKNSSGKTLLWSQAIDNFLTDNKNSYAIIVFGESDDSAIIRLQKKWNKRIRVIDDNDIDTVQTKLYKSFTTIENLKPIKNDIKIAVVIDSWGSLTYGATNAKIESGDQASRDFGRTTKLNELARIFHKRPKKANACVFVVAHVYIDMKTKQWIFKGGEDISLASESLLLLTKYVSKIKKEDRDKRTCVKFEKRKGRPPTKEMTTQFIPIEYHKGGFTRFGGMFELCHEILGIIKGKSWYYFEDTPDKKFRRTDESVYTKERLLWIEEKAQPYFCYVDDSTEFESNDNLYDSVNED